MSSPLLIIVLTAVIMLQSSCKKAGLFQQAGEEVVETRTVAAYREIVLNDKIDLVLVYDSVESITVRAGKNLIAGIETSVQNGLLTIRDQNKFRWSRNLDEQITVTITGRQLEKIIYNGAGNVKSQNQWHANRFDVDCQVGTGSILLDIEAIDMYLSIRQANPDVTISGKTTYAICYIADHGSINLEKLLVSSMNLDYRSIRKSIINVRDKLQIKIQQSGDVFYKGNPEIILLRNNTGHLIKAA